LAIALSTNVPPVITSVSNLEDTTLTLSGSNFDNVTDILINHSILASNYTLNSNSIIIEKSESYLVNSLMVFDIFGNTFEYTDIPDSLPTMPICFPAGTPVNTDQGIIEINKIIPNVHTIRNKKIVAISKTVTFEDSIVCIEKDALGPNIPSQTTYISRNHTIFYKKHMVSAKALIGVVDKVYNKSYKGEPLYNVLLETHDKMIVNNLIVETLDPESFMGKFYTLGFTDEEKKDMIIQMKQFAKDYVKQHGLNKKKHLNKK
jgi:hypothetical protein